MNLTLTTSTIEVVLASAVTTSQLVVTASGPDFDATTSPAWNKQTLTNSTTAVTAVAAPATGFARKISSLAIYNADTVNATVTVRRNDNGTLSPIVRIVLAAGFTLQYTDTAGWYTLDLTATKVGPTGATGTTGATGATASRVVTTLAISAGVVNIDLSLGDLFALSLTENVTSITFSNLPGAGNGQAIFVRMKQDVTGSRTVALPSSLKAIVGSDTAVQAAANAYTCLAATSVDNGTRWEYAMKAGA